MKKHVSFFVPLLTISTLLLPQVFGSGPSPPPRALPEGAKMRIGQGRGVDFAFSPDGNRIAVACSIIGIWIHDAHTGSELALLTGHTDAVTSVAYSSDGKTLASGSYDHTVRLWDAHTFEPQATLTGHTGDTKALAFSPDGTTLATGASRSSAIRRFNLLGEEVKVQEEIDSSIRLWDVATGKLKLTLTGHTGWITALTYSSDGTTLASASTDGTVHLWDGTTGKHKITLKEHKQNVNSVEFSPDSKRLASWGSDATVRLWDPHTGKQIAIIDDNHYGAVAFSPDSSTLVSSQGRGNSTIRLWNAHTGEQKAKLEAQLGSIFSVVFSPDGSKLVTTEDWQNKTIRSWDINSLEFQTDLKGDPHVVHSPQRPHPTQVVGSTGWNARLEYSPDGATLTSWSFDEIRLWDAHTGEQKAKMGYPRQREHRYGRPFVAFSSDAATFACGNGTAKIWLFDADTYKFRAALNGHTDVVYAAALSLDGTTLASASKDKTLRLWDVQTGKHRVKLNGHTDVVHTLAFSQDGTMLASGSADRKVILWNVQTGETLKKLVGHTNTVGNVVFAADGETLASVSEKEIRVWNAFTGKQRFTLEGHPLSTSSLAFSPDGKILATGHKWEIKLWDVHTGQLQNTLSGHLDNNRSLVFSPDGTLLVSSGETVQLWETSTGKNLSTLSKKRGLGTLAFSADGKMLAGADGSSIELWDVSIHQHITTLRGHSSSVTSIAISPKDGTLASASYDGTIVLWEPVNVVDKNIIAKITPLSAVSSTIGKQITFSIEIAGAENVVGYQLTLQFDETALQYISSNNGDYLPGTPFFIKPVLEKNNLTLASTALTGSGNGDGTLATVTFEIIAVKPTSLNINNLILSDKAGKRLRPDVKSEKEKKK